MSLVEILKNCPKGMKLYSPIYGEVEFTEVSVVTGSIGCKTSNGITRFYPDGTYYKGGECMLFPSKEQRDWDEFMIPFNDGDIIIKNEPNIGCKYRNIAIFKSYNNNSTNKMNVYCQVNGANEFKTEMSIQHQDWRMATAEEGRRLFTKMHESGYDFLGGKLVTIPVFKVGDVITNGTYTFKISHVDERFYYEKIGTTVGRLLIQDQDKWKIKKFDVQSLKPYDKVLVRFEDGTWYPTLVSYVNSTGQVYLIDCEEDAKCVIPFEGNERLIGEYDDPDPYYITWQE